MRRVQSIERGIDILLALAGGARTLTDVTRATGLSKGTAFRLLVSLNHEQLVVRDPRENGYLLGPGFLRLFQGVMDDLGAIATLARPALEELWRASGETVTLHVRSGAERICVAELPSAQPIRYVAAVGATAPLHVGSAGKVLLAFMPPEELTRALGSLPLTGLTHATITDREALRQELATVTRQGWAMSSGERIVGASAISVPVSASNGLLAALSVLGPADRLTPQKSLDLLPAIRAAAVAIEQILSSPATVIDEDADASAEAAAPPPGGS
ncbi:MAG TPA: IclR family transcriptional regulator [Conexibacter sp.]|jgi:DNA-binding IclR family transcriptional regulator